MAIRYDENYIKRPNIELEFTEEQVEELMKCRDDVLYFTENYVFWVLNGYNKLMSLVDDKYPQESCEETLARRK